MYAQGDMHAWVCAQGACVSRGACVPRGHVCPGGHVCLGACMPHMAPLWTEFLRHACENITFPQLLLWAVINSSHDFRGGGFSTVDCIKVKNDCRSTFNKHK